LTVVLDCWAILRYLSDMEPAASLVGELLSNERPIMSWINVGEVFYVVRRERDEEAATATVRQLRLDVLAELPTDARILEAARLKADHRMSYADAFAAATTMAHRATLWTGDPELLVEAAPWQWRDLRL
jgi:predicted nucleic acid-binding protein